MLNIKVGVMPGKLTEVVAEEGTKVRDIFALAEIDIEGYELRLDGEKIDGDCTVNGGNLLVAMKKIKGNKWERDDSSEYHNLPITVDKIAHIDDLVILDGKYVMSRDEFEEVYYEIEEKVYSEYDREKLVDVYSEVESIVDDLRTVLREIEDLLDM